MSSDLSKTFYQSPIGLIEISGSENGIDSLFFLDEAAPGTVSEVLPALLRECAGQLDEYFSGRRREFSLKLHPQGTQFQMKVWDQLRTIPFGKTASYQDIALALGDANAVRAVGSANGKNPLSIVVPCHRVIGRDGRLIGYGGGIWRKEWLLQHEGAII